jgi:hypothetical protein
MSMRMTPGKKQQSSMMLSGIKPGVKTAVEKALDDKKKYDK